MTARATTDLDKALGQRLRSLRLRTGLSQPELAEAIGVTFQQLQKYEVGSNRIPATRLMAIAAALDVPVNELLEVITSNTKTSRAKPSKLYPDSAEAHDLLAVFCAIQSKAMRRRVVEIVRMMGESSPPGNGKAEKKR